MTSALPDDYKSITDLYGKRPANLVLAAGSVLTFAGIVYIPCLYAAVGLGIGSLMSILKEDAIRKYLHQKNMSAEQGSRWLRRIQFASTAVGLCAGIGMGAIALEVSRPLAQPASNSAPAPQYK